MITDPNYRVQLKYTVFDYSSYQKTHNPENIITNDPQNSNSRWTSSKNNSDQFLVLKLEDDAIITGIYFGKYHKPHVCNLKKLNVYSMSIDNRDKMCLCDCCSRFYNNGSLFQQQGNNTFKDLSNESEYSESSSVNDTFINGKVNIGFQSENRKTFHSKSSKIGDFEDYNNFNYQNEQQNSGPKCHEPCFKVDYTRLNYENPILILEGTLKNNNQGEYLSVDVVHKNCFIVSNAVKICPVACYGPNYNFSIWHVKLFGINRVDILKRVNLYNKNFISGFCENFSKKLDKILSQEKFNANKNNDDTETMKCHNNTVVSSKDEISISEQDSLAQKAFFEHFDEKLKDKKESQALIHEKQTNDFHKQNIPNLRSNETSESLRAKKHYSTLKRDSHEKYFKSLRESIKHFLHERNFHAIENLFCKFFHQNSSSENPKKKEEIHKFKKIKPKKNDQWPLKRGGFASTIHENKIYISGGWCGKEVLDDLWEFDCDTYKFQKLSVKDAERSCHQIFYLDKEVNCDLDDFWEEDSEDFMPTHFHGKDSGRSSLVDSESSREIIDSDSDSFCENYNTTNGNHAFKNQSTGLERTSRTSGFLRPSLFHKFERNSDFEINRYRQFFVTKKSVRQNSSKLTRRKYFQNQDIHSVDENVLLYRKNCISDELKKMKHDQEITLGLLPDQYCDEKTMAFSRENERQYSTDRLLKTEYDQETTPGLLPYQVYTNNTMDFAEGNEGRYLTEKLFSTESDREIYSGLFPNQVYTNNIMGFAKGSQRCYSTKELFNTESDHKISSGLYPDQVYTNNAMVFLQGNEGRYLTKKLFNTESDREIYSGLYPDQVYTNNAMVFLQGNEGRFLTEKLSKTGFDQKIFKYFYANQYCDKVSTRVSQKPDLKIPIEERIGFSSKSPVSAGFSTMYNAIIHDCIFSNSEKATESGNVIMFDFWKMAQYQLQTKIGKKFFLNDIYGSKFNILFQSTEKSHRNDIFNSRRFLNQRPHSNVNIRKPLTRGTLIAFIAANCYRVFLFTKRLSVYIRMCSFHLIKNFIHFCLAHQTNSKILISQIERKNVAAVFKKNTITQFKEQNNLGKSHNEFETFRSINEASINISQNGNRKDIMQVRKENRNECYDNGIRQNHFKNNSRTFLLETFKGCEKYPDKPLQRVYQSRFDGNHYNIVFESDGPVRQLANQHPISSFDTKKDKDCSPQKQPKNKHDGDEKENIDGLVDSHKDQVYNLPPRNTRDAECQGCLLIFGGYISSPKFPRKMAITKYYMQDKTVETILHHQGPRNMFDNQCAQFGDQILIFGGKIQKNQKVMYCGFLKFYNNKFYRLKDERPHRHLMDTRVGHSMVLIRNKKHLSDWLTFDPTQEHVNINELLFPSEFLIVIGGSFENKFFYTVTYYDTKENTIFKVVKLPKEIKNRVMVRSQVVSESLIYIMFCYNSDYIGETNEMQIYSYDIYKFHFEKIHFSRERKPSPRSAHCFLFNKHKNSIFIFGGNESRKLNARLNDMWQLILPRKISPQELQKRLLRKLRHVFARICRNSGSKNANEYIRNNIYPLYDLSDPVDSNEFKIFCVNIYNHPEEYTLEAALDDICSLIYGSGDRISSLFSKIFPD